MQLSQQATRQQQRRASARQSARSRWQLPRASCTRTLLPARCLASRSLSQQSANRCHRTKAKAERNSALLFSCRFLLISVVRAALDNLNHISVDPIHTALIASIHPFQYSNNSPLKSHLFLVLPAVIYCKNLSITPSYTAVDHTYNEDIFRKGHPHRPSPRVGSRRRHSEIRSPDIHPPDL